MTKHTTAQMKELSNLIILSIDTSLQLLPQSTGESSINLPQSTGENDEHSILKYFRCFLITQLVHIGEESRESVDLPTRLRDLVFCKLSVNFFKCSYHMGRVPCSRNKLSIDLETTLEECSNLLAPWDCTLMSVSR